MFKNFICINIPNTSRRDFYRSVNTMKRVIFSHPAFKPRFHLPELRKNLLFYLMLLSLFIGVAVGALHGRNADPDSLRSLDVIFLTDFSVRRGGNMGAAFVSSFASVFIFLLVIFVSGLALWGCSIAAVVPFVKGFGYGLSVGYLYAAYGGWGILYNLLIIFPGAMLCCAVIASAARQAIVCSAKLTSVFRKTPVSDDPRVFLRHYLLSMLWLLFLAAVSSGLDTVFSALFSGLFNF